jgi:hypothetical protein
MCGECGRSGATNLGSKNTPSDLKIFSNFHSAGFRMRVALLLRIVSVLAFMHGLLHTIGGVFGGAAPGAQLDTVTVMKANRFVAMGVTRSYWDYYFGYGLMTTVNFLVQTFVFWQLATIAKTDPEKTRPIVATFCMGYLVSAVVAWRYFFAGPAVLEVVMAGVLFAAWLAAKREAEGLVTTG